MEFIYNDGGRELAGFKGEAGDCVTRAIAIANPELSYQEVYDALAEKSKNYANSRKTKVARALKKRGTSSRNGVFKAIYKAYLEELGWKWTPTMFIGSGCTCHVVANELPKGVVIVGLSRHIATVIDGVLHDTYDCSREGTRCVYGYYTKD